MKIAQHFSLVGVQASVFTWKGAFVCRSTFRIKIHLVLVMVLIHSAVFAQRYDSISVNRPIKFSTKQLYKPGALLASGLLTNIFFTKRIKYEIVEERNEHIPRFSIGIGSYLQFIPIPIAYGLDAFGVKSKNDFLNRSAILVKGEIMTGASTYILKTSTRQLRPDGSDRLSFPSGHAAQAFAAATFLSEEYKDRLPWIPYAAYSVASSAGLLRIANNRHYLSDVLFGAGLGILSMKVAYWTHGYKWGKSKKRQLQSLVY